MEAGIVRFGVYGGGISSGPNRVIDSINPVIEPSKCTHLVGTFNPNSQEMHVYVNGVEASSAFLPTHQAQVYKIFDGSSPLRIGARVVQPGKFTNLVDGQIDEVKIYNVVLTAEEIGTMYESRKVK